MKIYAVIDTNVLVSAMLAKHQDSAPLLILENLFSRQIIPMYNDEILAEYNEVLRRPHFPFDEEDIDFVLHAIMESGMDSLRTSTEDIVFDPKDVVFYEVAMSREDSYLITGNIKHFPRKTRVVTPNEMLDIINAAE